jgi:hypothetical protein
MNSQSVLIFFLATCVLLNCLNDAEGFVSKRINDVRRRSSKKAKKMLKKELRMIRKASREMKLAQQYVEKALAWKHAFLGK